MSKSWLDEYHEKCDLCEWDPKWDNCESKYEYYWKREVRRCRGYVCHFEYILMSPGDPRKADRVGRVCTASYHGNVVHVHVELGNNRGLASTEWPCVPGNLKAALVLTGWALNTEDAARFAEWRAETWVRKIHGS